MGSCLLIDQEMVYSVSLSFSFQTSLLSAVWYRFLCWKLLLWWLYLVLKGVDVIPMYVLVSVSVASLASYTMLSIVHFPGSGHDSLLPFLQLHRGSGFSTGGFKILLLCLLIIVAMLGMQE